MAHTFTAGIVQFDIQPGKTDTNLDHVYTALDALVCKGVRLAVLPEMFSCSFDNENLSSHCEQTHQIVEQLSQYAKDRKIAIAGSVPQKEKNRIYNTLFFIDVNGQIKGQYHKIHLFKLTDEDRYYTPGNQVCTVDSSFGRIGLMTCYDLRFPELARNMFLKGVQMILVSAQWPDSRIHHWQVLNQARAIENQLYMISANRIGTEGELTFSGHSMIVDPSGRVLADVPLNQTWATGQIDLETIGSVREQIPCMKDRRQDIYG